MIESIPIKLLETIFQTTEQSVAIEALLSYIEEQMPSSIHGRLFVYEAQTHRLRHFMPPSRRKHDEPPYLPIGPEMATSGRAAFFRKDICTLSVEDDPGWEPYWQRAKERNIQACWAFPMLSSSGELLGVMTFLFNEKLKTVPYEYSEFFGGTVHLAKLIIERFHSVNRKEQLLERLQTSQHRLELALRARKMGVWDVNLETGVMVWDDQMYHIYELAKSEFGGTIDWWMSVIHKDDVPRIFAEFERATVQGKQYSIQFRIHTKSGIRYIKSAAVFHFNENGKPIRMTGLNWDRTEHVLRTQKIERARAKSIASSKMASLGEMASGIAHEINNPLTIILNRASHLQTRLRKGPIDTQWALEELDKIESTVERIAKIIRGLRAFSRNGDKDPFVPTNFENIVEETLEFCREKFKNHDIDLQVRPLPDIHIPCRPSQISQVLLNLLNNSFDAIQGSKGAWVKIEAEALSDRLRVSVVDSGNGISRVISDKIMEPFFTTKEVGKGTGLGLSISKGIVEEHQGVLYLDRDCQNTRFVFELPVELELQPEILQSDFAENLN